MQTAHQMEQQLTAAVRERQISEFVEDHEVAPSELLGGAPLTTRARIRPSVAGNFQSLNGAPFLNAPGFLFGTGT